MNKVFIVMLLIFFCTVSSMALELRCEDDVLINLDESVDEDFIAIGDTIAIEGKIKGDFIGIGKIVNCRGVIGDDISVVGRNIDIEGDINDSIRAAGEKIKINAHVKSDVILFAGTVKLLEDCLVEGDAIIGGEEVEIDGKFLQNLKVYGKKVKIKGNIAKDVKLKAGKIIIFPGARIGGDIDYTCAEQIEIRGNPSVDGEVIWSKPAIKPKGAVSAKSYRKRFFTNLLFTIPVLFIGLILIAITPAQVYITMHAMDKFPGKSIAAGFVFLICVPAVAVMLFATIVGIPLALIVLLSYFSAIYISKLFTGMYIGMKIFSLKDEPRKSSLALSLTIGTIIVVMLSTIPRIGGFVRLLIIMFGLGSFVVSRWQTFILAREKKLI